jgi:exodeoxyribonuclease VII small subunit
MQKAKNLDYQTAYDELRAILADIQQGTVSLDDLTTKVERANELVRHCRERLRQTETALQQLLPQQPPEQP